MKKMPLKALLYMEDVFARKGFVRQDCRKTHERILERGALQCECRCDIHTGTFVRKIKIDCMEGKAMKTKTKHIIYGILYLIMCIISMGFIDIAFTAFINRIDVYSFVVLAIFSFSWWKSISGMCKHIVYLRFIQMAEEQVKKNAKQE